MGKASRAVVEEMKVPKLMEEIKELHAKVADLERDLDILKKVKSIDEESLAKMLHESGREAVLSNNVLKKDGSPIGQIKFVEWEQLPDGAKEGRRMMARYLLKHSLITL